ncbi:hypothetical protein HD806DRAFT_534130 [Xylariaceae sp. AK1471]|nr:hypothetical protein HD806DRAFT_534130 [Xylariaceae sp. AK1471]
MVGLPPSRISLTSPHVQRDDIRDIDLSIRFKHGNQTIFLFIDPMKPFSCVQDELLEILNERYPDGITTSVIPPKKTKLPTDASQIKFALPKNTTDPTQGWKPLEVEADDTPVGKGLEDDMIVAFAIATDFAEDLDDVKFEVELPSYEDETNDAGEL